MRLATSLVIALWLALASPARACWDGELGTVGNVTYMGSRIGWDEDRARELATWLVRLDAIVPPGTTLTIEWNTVSLCRGERCDDWRWNGRSFARLFAEVARRSGAGADRIRAARARSAPVHTVQVAALTDRARAEELARRIHEAGAGEHGFYETGGFPADNATAHVVSVSLRGRTLHRVIVGAFVDRAQALRVRDGIAAQLGVHGIVRTL